MPKQYGPYKLQANFSVVTVPEEVRNKLGLEKGDLVAWIIDDEGHCILKKVKITEG
jgi:bifunctional DNA-binding transcriptional regulator/antitoxin component of YhaV-PrlF toxin-antitoxin module